MKMAGAASLQQLQWPLASSSSFSSINFRQNYRNRKNSFISNNVISTVTTPKICDLLLSRGRRSERVVVLVGNREETGAELFVSDENDEEDEDEEEEEVEPSPEDMEYVAQIKRVLELLRKNRDMLFSEVKLTIMIEDPREIERRRLLGIDDPDTPTREELAEALEKVNEGKIPKDRMALRMLAEEMMQWPNLEVEATKKKAGKSLYAKVTDTGIDPAVAAKRLNVDWDSAAEIEEAETNDETEVPPVVGYGALYLVSAFPVIIGISVVLILFYNSLQ